MKGYHYRYYWLCVDLCNGGARRGNYHSQSEARWDKPQNGLWTLKRERVWNEN